MIGVLFQEMVAMHPPGDIAGFVITMILGIGFLVIMSSVLRDEYKRGKR